MRRNVARKRIKVLVVIVAASAGAWAVGAARDTYKVAKMTEKMKPVCVGRMMIDLPEEARVELYGGWVEGFNITAYPESDVAFTERVAAREKEIRAKPDPRGGNNNMEAVREVRTESGLTGKIFIHGRYLTETTRNKGAGTERFSYEGINLEAHVHADGISIDLTAEDHDPGRIENLPRLVTQLVANPANRIPTEAGFCIDYAYVRDPLQAGQGERVNMTAILPSHPDIAIKFDTIAGIKPDSQGLLKRNHESHARAPHAVNMRFTNLRAASRTIGGLVGDELVERVLEENFAIIYGFQWEVNGRQDNVFEPHLLLLMATGRGDDAPVQSSLSQHAALTLWDRISSSVRVRPTKKPRVNEAQPTSPRIGALAAAGEACPESGWWQCGDGGDGIGVLGGQRQYIKRGERMPQALLLPAQTLWEKVRGIQQSFESRMPTSWKLVDKRSRKRIKAAVPLAQAGPMSPDAAVSDGTVAHHASVGAYAATGVPCPASGWWRCEESQALDGTRWFAHGSLLPAATFTVPPGVLGKASSGPRSIQRRASWRLVRLAPSPAAGPSPDAPGTLDLRDKVGPGRAPGESAT
jgi:hypothetical protein